MFLSPSSLSLPETPFPTRSDAVRTRSGDPSRWRGGPTPPSLQLPRTSSDRTPSSAPGLASSRATRDARWSRPLLTRAAFLCHLPLQLVTWHQRTPKQHSATPQQHQARTRRPRHTRRDPGSPGAAQAHLRLLGAATS